MPTDDRVAIHLELLKAADQGRLRGLDYPICHRPEVSVWFTHPAPEHYRIWFICDNCDFHTRAQCSARPKHFTQTRVKPQLEDLDLEIINSALFPRPGDH